VDYELRGQLDASLVDMVNQAPDTLAVIKAKLASAPQSQAADVLGGPAGLVFAIGSGRLQVIGDPHVGPGVKFADVKPRDVAVAAGTSGPYFWDTIFDHQRYRVYTAPLPGTPRTIVRAARPESDPTPTLHRLLWLLVVLTPTAGLIAAGTARLLAGRVLQPVSTLTSAVERITVTGDLAVPVGVRGTDEVGRLGRAFTAMTAALDGSVGAQRRLVADASHELRTPLTSLMTNLELVHENPADPATPALVADALEQARELKILINDLVDLARFGEVAAREEFVRLDLVAEQVAERRGVDVGIGIASDRTEAAILRGDPDAVERAVANLVDNAVKFSGNRGVLVSVTVRDRDAVLEVRDDGPGIPVSDLAHVFDRFHRSPSARALPGSGLGLAIVKQIAEAHGGRVEALPSDRGAWLRMTLPVVEGVVEGGRD
jgi:two-component system sensor histidine kinase MprB